MSWLSDQFNAWKLKRAYNWGKGRAKTKLRLFYTYQEQNPKLTNKELYYLTVLTTVSFTEATALAVVEHAEQFTQTLINKPPLGLRHIVKSMLIFEGQKIFHSLNYEDRTDTICEALVAVDDIIPENL